MVGPAVKREAVAHLRTMFQMSERRACSVIAADRTSIRYRVCRPPDTDLRCRLRDLANARRRFGYRRLFVLLRQQGEPSGINRIYRLYREEGLTVRRRRVRRRARWIPTDIRLPAFILEVDPRLIQRCAEQVIRLQFHARTCRRADAQPVKPQSVAASDPVLLVKRQKLGQS